MPQILNSDLLVQIDLLHSQLCEKEVQIKKERKRAEDLWNILESIDIYLDALHPTTNEGRDIY